MKQVLLKCFAIPSVIFILSFGLIAGCGDRDSNEVETEDPIASEQQRTNEDQPKKEMMKGETYRAMLSGSNQVPSVTTEASGEITVTVMGDSILVEGEFSDLSSEYVASHIHKGAKNENGGPVLTLNPTVGPNRNSGSWDDRFYLEKAQRSALEADSLYINVHSAKNKDGEIRGQLTAAGSER